MISHENYEKRSLNMEFNYNSNTPAYNIYKALQDETVHSVSLGGFGLILKKDYLPDGTPCWRLPTQEEINEFNKEKTKDEI